MELKKLNWTTFFITAFLIGFVLIVIISITEHHNNVASWEERILEVIYKSRVEQQYGFKMEKTVLDLTNERTGERYKGKCLVASKITLGGKADKLGFKIGDVPVNLYHHCALEGGWFYYGLAHPNQFHWCNVVQKNDMCENWEDKARHIELNPKKES